MARAAQQAVALAQQEKSTWTRADLVKYFGRVLPRTGRDPAEVRGLLENLADRALRSEFEPVCCLEAPELADGPVPRQPPDLTALAREISELAARHREITNRLADRNSLLIPAEDPDVEAHQPAFPFVPRRVPGAILQPLPPEIRPLAPILQRAPWPESGREAGG